MYSTIINTVTGLFQSYLTNKQHKAELKQAIHKKQLDEIQQGNISATELDSLSIQSRGWKDDFLLIVTVTPLVLCFVPEMGSHIKNGFDVLNASVPEWYMVALALVYIDTFGFRRILRKTLENYSFKPIGK
ncbi:hypothetical protein [Spartinivicinus poritis]|uniref:Holin of 3TMs, for gene-transfer release n=1 Tax=Spartinivicinus poritis TaxID=2994640 RepID=A0ABT5UIF8_9GAMM|nr:hypothetical protein [Spartinivicinus sp. A2-2]MDE1465312.1 hypothetical protein [Spartinivicinus sp. A2-2]